MEKRVCSWLLTFVMVLGLLSGTALAAAEDITVYVTISQDGQIVTGKDGELVAEVPVVLSGQTEYTIDDALRAAHSEYYSGGAEAGYGSSIGDFGLGLDKLWGDESGAFGYYLNDVSAWSLAAPVEAGDSISAFIYQDQKNYNDQYSYFDQHQVTVAKGEALTLTLNVVGYDKEWQPVSYPLSNAEVTINGTASNTTNDKGEVALTFDTIGTYVVSAAGPEGTIIVSPVCVVQVVDENQAGGIFVNGIQLAPAFAPEVMAYTLPDQPYTKASIGVKVNVPQEVSVQIFNNEREIAVSGDGWTNVPLTAGKNEIKFAISRTGGGTANYTVNVNREVALSDLKLVQKDYLLAVSPAIDPNTAAYSAAAASGVELKILPTVGGDMANTEITINGEVVSESGYAVADGTNTYTIKLASRDKEVVREYILSVTGYQAVEHTFTVPEGSVLTLTDASNNVVSLPDGTTVSGQTSYMLLLDQSVAPYTWHVGQYGFFGKSGTVDLNNSSTKVELTAAAEPVSDIKAQWKNFRNSDNNMAVTTARVPRNAGEAELKWAAAVAAIDRYGYSMPTSYIMVDGKLITASGDQLSQINAETGAVEKSVTMTASRGYAYMSPAYGGGMIYVALGGGIVQAFDAQTLESKWIYTDPLGGQALSAIIYDDGYVYTGFGNNDTNKYDWVCVPAADEDPTTSNEDKEAVWTYAHNGGFYWSGGCVVGNYIVAGGDSSTLLVFDKRTGEVVDSETVNGDIRCSIAAYDTNSVCFVTKSGSFYTAEIGGDGQLTGLTEKVSVGGASTSTPLVIDGYAYVGVSKAWKDTYVAQINMATGEVATVPTTAYPQSSMLASTAYDGAVYLYFTCNGKPGGIQVIEVASDGAMTLGDLYTPGGDKQNYCIASVMCDEQGILYYANDSGHLFAIETWQAKNCPVSFQVTPADASIEVRDHRGSIVDPAHEGIYDLIAGTYSYTIVSEGKSKSGTLTITDSYVANHVPQTISVTLDEEQGGSAPSTEKIMVSIRVADPQGKTYLSKKSYTVGSGTTVYELLEKTGLNIQSTNTEFGIYIQAIEGLGEFDEGSDSGWMYRVNGIYPQTSASAAKLADGDYVEWLYTRDLGEDIGGGSIGGGTAAKDKAAAEKAETLIGAIGAVNEGSGEAIQAAREAYDALTDAQKKWVTNYSVLTAAEEAYAALTKGFPFTDVGDHWALEAIRYVYERGLMNGTGTETFSPEEVISRGMIVTILYRLEGTPAVSGEEAFPDVAEDMYYTDAVTWAVEHEIIKGYDSGLFRPDDPITREQLAVILCRYAGMKGLDVSAAADLSGFADADRVSVWSLDALRWANGEGLINGVGEDLLAPQGSTDRAQAVVILMRYLKNVVE